MRRNIVALLVPLVGLLTVDAALAAKKAANAPLLKLFETSWQEDLADDPMSRHRARRPSLRRAADRHVGGNDRQAQPAHVHAHGRAAQDRQDQAREGRPAQLRPVRARNPHSPQRSTVQAVPVRHPHLRRPATAARARRDSSVPDGQGLRQLDRAHQRQRRVHRPVDRVVRPGRHRASHAAAHHRAEGARADQAAARHRPGSERVLRAVQEDAGQLRCRHQGPAHRRRQDRHPDRGGAGLPALRQVLPRCLSTRVARHDRHLRHAGWRAVLQGPRQVLHDHRQPRCDAHPQHRPRGSEAHPRRDGKDARGHQLPGHARSVPVLHPHRSALLLQDARRAVRGV